ncbi:Coq4 family protein [Sandarakinorhabdus sp. DWP1-3-1]|uniref:Coq4 family protein n=1 Tax=Sandarakinorhabdus sp. DWP1-3-1 TaxID=2804627 RepID=UPI003CF1A329
MTAHTAIAAAPEPRRLPVPRKEWGAAFRALQRLLRDKDDTREVFEIMRALNGDSTRKGYHRLLATAEGGRLAYQREELADRLSDRAWLATLPAGSLGAVYRDFTDTGGVTPQGLVEVSNQTMIGLEHPVAWFGRRIRDSHDLWHVTTGYGLDSLGEACLVAFSYAQTRALGWAFIAVGAAFKSRKAPVKQPYVAAIREGYRRGRAARWLPAQDWLALLPLPIDDVRARLGLIPAPIYRSIPVELRGQAVPKG